MAESFPPTTGPDQPHLRDLEESGAVNYFLKKGKEPIYPLKRKPEKPLDERIKEALKNAPKIDWSKYTPAYIAKVTSEPWPMSRWHYD